MRIREVEPATWRYPYGRVRVGQTWSERDTGLIVTRVWTEPGRLCVQTRDASAPPDAAKRWVDAQVRMHQWLKDEIAAAPSALLSAPDDVPPNYWWDHKQPT